MDWRKGHAWRLARRWTVIVVAWIAALVVEGVLLGEGVLVAWGVTTLLAILIGSVSTRRLRAADEEPLITVRDLRRR